MVGMDQMGEIYEIMKTQQDLTFCYMWRVTIERSLVWLRRCMDWQKQYWLWGQKT